MPPVLDDEEDDEAADDAVDDDADAAADAAEEDTDEDDVNVDAADDAANDDDAAAADEAMAVAEEIDDDDDDGEEKAEAADVTADAEPVEVLAWELTGPDDAEADEVGEPEDALPDPPGPLVPLEDVVPVPLEAVLPVPASEDAAALEEEEVAPGAPPVLPAAARSTQRSPLHAWPCTQSSSFVHANSTDDRALHPAATASHAREAATRRTHRTAQR